ncbi:hypothetical protein [Halosegnis sp.]|uniref:hypothetical protein n=1 Tax=Halosegnis sp. TaxID=2864959 RepID=UPI0035D422E7
MSETGLGTVLQDARTNAAAAWLLIAFLLVVAGANAVTVDPLWAGFAVVVAALALVLPVVYRNPLAMLPWEVLFVAALPLVARVLVEFAPLQSDVITYIAVAAVALVVAVELHLLTPVEMSYRFAVAFVIIATMAAAGLWAVVRYASDILLGTTLLLPPGGTAASEAALAAAEHQLMIEFVASFIAGIGAGALFEGYFRRLGRDDELLAAIEQEV